MAGFSVPAFTWFYQGTIAAGGSVNVYQSGTTTPIIIYADGALTTPLTNPLTLDANGQCKFYISGSVNIRMDGYTSQGAFIETIDPIYPTSGTGTTAGTVVYQGTNFTLSTNNNGNNIIATAGINIALPLTTGFNNSFSVQLNAQGGAITLIPNAADKIQGQTAGVNYILPKNSTAELWTDAAGNWGLNFLSLGMAGFNFNAITGNLPSAISGTNTTAAITVSSGFATDATNTIVITGAGYSWAASNGNAINGTDAASSTLANSTTYHMFLCAGSSGVGTFASASLSAALPAGYNSYKRRIFSFNTNSSGSPIPYTAIETEGGSYLAWLATQVLDINTTTLTTSRALFVLTVPIGIKVEVKQRASGNSSTSNQVLLTSGDETDVAPAVAAVPLFSFNGANTSFITEGEFLTTNTSGQIGARSTAASTTLQLVTRGFKDWRRV